VTVPKEVTPIVEHTLSAEALETGWDELVRVVASIGGGWTSAVLALERFGSASRADPIHKTGTALGQWPRSLFLGDYFTVEAFRRELSRRLSHSESVHTMLEGRPKDCDVGTKRNSQGRQESWTSYKLHIEAADGGIPISCVRSPTRFFWGVEVQRNETVR
jgi:hypothetical protein